MRRRQALSTVCGLGGALWMERLGLSDSSIPAKPRDRLTGRDARLTAQKIQRLVADARAGGTPLVILAIPESEEDQDARGKAWGELLNHGTHRDLQLFAHVNLACLSQKEMNAVGVSANDSAWAVLVDGAGTRDFATDIPAYPDPHQIWISPGPSDEKLIQQHEPLVERERAVYRVRHARMSELMGKISAPFALSANRAEADASLARKRILRRDPPLGSHWAKRESCGGPYVEETNFEAAKRRANPLVAMIITVVGCGGGHVPEKSARFLHFATLDELDRIAYVDDK